MSSAVMGSPLTITTTCCAEAIVGHAKAASRTNVALTSNLRQVRNLSNIIAPFPLCRCACFMIEPVSYPGARLMGAGQSRQPGIEGRRADSTAGRIAAESAQTDLQHVGVIDRNAAAIRITRDVIER